MEFYENYDCISIKDLECYGHHGVLKEENKLGQKFLVSCDLYLDMYKACRSDDIKDSVSYADIAHFINKIMGEREFSLIEAAAESIAEEILIKYEKIKKIRVKIKKPWAPILLPLDTVSVCIERKWEKVFVGVGSNMGDREKNIKNSVEEIKGNRLCRNVKESKLRETKPYGYTEQDDFLNSVIEFETVYFPFELLNLLQDIELRGGRERNIHWGPRTIDLDILFYGKKVIEEENLTVPHRDIANRAFVLEPLCDLEPDFIHPVLGESMSKLLSKLMGEGDK